METVEVFGQYKVYIDSGVLKNLDKIVDLTKFSKVVVITDEKIPNNHLGQFERIIVPSGEGYKNIETVRIIWKKLLDLRADRKSLVINLGGGVIGDMGGFAAGTFMRGLKFLQVPTTLLAAVDASVGGKVGIDFEGVKNLIGSFNQPIGVIVDVDTFQSLPDREFVSGFGEIIKHGIIADANYFKEVTSKKPRDFSKEELIGIIKKSCQIKAEIISSDEKESGSRKLLNFGHTIGHAIESDSLSSDQPLLHGEAVSIGMMAEAVISQQVGYISQEGVLKIKNALENAGLPTDYKIKDQKRIIELLSRDKKSEAGSVNWTLIKDIGEAIINQPVSEDKIIPALQFIAG
ncbi:MAG TPA: 3-dehydroquinate synthase [Patescibacteria group bacterium]|nr:3-dehydroquinate synthase [Patescibacteria group bacterium]